MILKELLASTPIYEIIGLRRIDITGITMRVEDVQKDYLYIYHAEKAGMSYEDAVSQAVGAGAAAICIDQEQNLLPYSITYIKTYHINRFLSAAARNFYQNPSQSMRLVGITGSHGKTTVGWMVKSILKAAGRKSVAMGMTRYQMADEPATLYEQGFNSITIHSKLRAALTRDIPWGIIECSYTGIIEEVMRHIRYNSLIYTDLYTYFQNQRADYHFFEIRKNLLDYLKLSNSPIIVNMDDYYAHELQRSTTLGYGLFYPGEINCRHVQLSPSGSRFTLETPDGTKEMGLKVPGIHNVYNAMAATAWGCGEGLSLKDIQQGLETFEEAGSGLLTEPLKGNIQVTSANGEDIPGLKTVYQKLKEQSKGQIISILCVGDGEESGGYKEWGRLAARYCSSLIITSDYRKPHNSMDAAFALAQGMKTPSISHEADNYKALQKAVNTAREGDTILLVR